MKKTNKYGLLALGLLIIATTILLFRKRYKARKLIIVGNGFDLHHGIQSGYLQFRDYLQKQDEEVFETLEKYLSLHGDKEWNDFENSLAMLDAEELMEEQSIYLGDWEQERLSVTYDYQYEVGRVLDKLGKKMKSHFLDWVLQLDISTNKLSRLDLPVDALFLNFNYTNSLEKLYEVPTTRILHIHGKAVDTSSQIVLGHGWGDYENATQPAPPQHSSLKENYVSRETDSRVEEAKAYIIDYFKNNFKNSAAIIHKNRSFFRRLKQIEEVYVLGHSMSTIDIKYFEEIVGNIDVKKVKWIVSVFNKEALERCTEAFYKLGIDREMIVFKRLDEVFIK